MQSAQHKRGARGSALCAVSAQSEGDRVGHSNRIGQGRGGDMQGRSALVLCTVAPRRRRVESSACMLAIGVHVPWVSATLALSCPSCATRTGVAAAAVGCCGGGGWQAATVAARATAHRARVEHVLCVLRAFASRRPRPTFGGFVSARPVCADGHWLGGRAPRLLTDGAGGRGAGNGDIRRQ